MIQSVRERNEGGEGEEEKENREDVVNEEYSDECDAWREMEEDREKSSEVKRGGRSKVNSSRRRELPTKTNGEKSITEN
jgi:hypothetical protein